MRIRIVLATLLLCLLSIHNASGAPSFAGDEPAMTAHFINVGQGEATLLEFPCGAVLVDAGAENPSQVADFMSYLHAFFARRGDLADTLDLVIITHNHPGHTRALPDVFRNFNVKYYVDNGHPANTEISGAQEWVRMNVPSEIVREVSAIEIAGLDDRTGLTGPQIDPLACAGTDPLIRVLAARHLEYFPTSFERIETPAGWAPEDFAAEDNQSLVVRVDYGEFSLLFTGDLGRVGIGTLIDYYRSGNLLDVDLYLAGGHGARDGTSDGLLEAMSPRLAVIAVGSWNGYPARRNGLPSLATWQRLEAAIPAQRIHPRAARLAEGPYRFRTRVVRSRVYATAWDGVIRVTATPTGEVTIETSRWRCARVSIPQR